MTKHSKEIYMYSLAGLVVVCTIVWFGLLIFHPVPAENDAILNTAAGIFLGSGWVTVMGYFFGSSKGSSDKTDMMRPGG